MEKKIYTIVVSTLITALFITGCRKPFEPPEINVVTNFLVVDGTITVGDNAVSTFLLSRTKRLSDSILFEPEESAQVYIEQEQGSSTLLEHKGEGRYQNQPSTFQVDRKYRLRILTGSKEYVSAYVEAKTSPPLDSITWEHNGDVDIFLHAYDPTGQTRYYRWEFVETWNYSSMLFSQWGVKNGTIFFKEPPDQTDSCWRTANSTKINIASSVALAEDRISNFRVHTIEQDSEKLSKGYHIEIKQYAITDEAYRYLRLIQKNTEQIGTLFDGQPSQLAGNLQCVDDPAEPVIGYITASTISTNTKFIRNEELATWNYLASTESCSQRLIVAQDPDNWTVYTYPNPNFSLYYFISSSAMVLAPKICLDCRELGGTNIKPSFW